MPLVPLPYSHPFLYFFHPLPNFYCFPCHRFYLLSLFFNIIPFFPSSTPPTFPSFTSLFPFSHVLPLSSTFFFFCFCLPSLCYVLVLYLSSSLSHASGLFSLFPLFLYLFLSPFHNFLFPLSSFSHNFLFVPLSSPSPSLPLTCCLFKFIISFCLLFFIPLSPTPFLSLVRSHLSSFPLSFPIHLSTLLPISYQSLFCILPR